MAPIYAFIIAIDKDKRLTGEYALTRFVVQEETPTEAFNKWLGNWIVTDGRLSYHITISSLEANMVYRVEGWEVFPEAQEQMNLESIETYFNNGDMYFVSQYIQSYEEDGSAVDEYFLGEYDYDGILHQMGLYIIPYEGIDLACAKLSSTNTATVSPCEIVAYNEGEEYKTVVYDMKYFCRHNSQWYFYNENVMCFPMTMTKTGPATYAPSSLHRKGSSSKPNRGNVFIPKKCGNENGID